MANLTTDFQIRPEDGWTLVATNPGELIIRPAVYHPWWVAITTTNSAPTGDFIGVPMGRDPSQRNQEYHLVNGVTGYVWVRINTPTDGNAYEHMMFNVTTGGAGTGGGGGGGTAGFETVGPPFVLNAGVTAGSGTITTGGTAQDILAAGNSPHAFAVQNQSAGDLYIRQTATATQDQNSLKIPAGMLYVSDYVTGDKVSIIGATTGQAFWARGW